MDRAEIYKEQARQVALMNARVVALTYGAGFILRKNSSRHDELALDFAADDFARRHADCAGAENKAFRLIVDSWSVQRWWSFTLADEPPGFLDHDAHYESAADVRALLRAGEEGDLAPRAA